jgi:Fic family protein
MKKSDPSKPNNNLPLLPPKVEVETKKILQKTIQANKALAELKAYAHIIPNQSILINSLILQEAKDSSEIENIITTHDELFKAFSIDSSAISLAAKEVLNYREALWYGHEHIQKKPFLNINGIIKIQEIIVQNKAGIRKQPGTVLKNDKTGEVIYTPPAGIEVINGMLKNLETYLNDDQDSVDPLIRMAIIHYQFESIHPFYDGNGRTGRIINVLYLILTGLLELPILYLSSYIIKHKASYYSLLQEVRTKNNWEGWILYILDSIEKTAKDTTSRIQGIKRLFDSTAEKIKEELPKVYTKELVEVIFSQPYCKINHLVDNGIVARQAAGRYLNQLEEIGVLESKKVGRDVLYINTKLYDLLRG